ncbi:MAG: entericidin A/B family lipoprotein [Proteobacteria bacterium]|nr:MAG: entericidin A/B family lipoprotein [Pseudomonadota bacterium]
MNPVLISKVVCTKSSAVSRHLTVGLAVLATAAFAFATTSCATTKGFGHDVKKVGNKIETKAAQTGGAN